MPADFANASKTIRPHSNHYLSTYYYQLVIQSRIARNNKFVLTIRLALTVVQFVLNSIITGIT